jgi:hypothetical protein
MRHAQVKEPCLSEIALTPIVRRPRPFYAIKDVDVFPSEDDCRQLVYEYCDYASDGPYHFYTRDVDPGDLEQLFDQFEYHNDLLIRAGACLYKGYVLLACSHMFAEEIYVNTFIAFEAMLEYLRSRRTNRKSRREIVNTIGDYVQTKEPGVDFNDYEAEMRDGIRNNIIHPFRRQTGERIAQPFLMADYVFEDLAFIDWLFKKTIQGEIR